MPPARTLPPRRGTPQPPAALPAPAAKVPARPTTHLRDAALLAAAGLAGFGAAPLVGYPVLEVPALLLGVGGGATLAVTGQRTKLRRELEDKVLEALAPLLGVRHLDRRIVKMTKWTNRWPGLPAKVRIHYAPGAPDSDPMWKSEILAVLDSRLLARYEVARHEPRRCTLWLTLVTKEHPEDKEPPYSQVRAERAITELIGPTAKVTGVELDGDELRSLTVTHQAGAKLAASGYRNRIERVISTMMPGRWRAVWDLEGDEARFEVRPTLPSTVWLPPHAREDTEDLLRNYRQVKIPCAIDEDGREIFWYPARVPQAMLTGGTGTGKTSTAHALLGQITQYGWPVWVLDAKRVEFLDFRTWPNVQIVAGSIPQQVALIRRVWELMEYRYQLIEEGKASVNDFEPLVVFLDEFAEFRSNLIEWYAQIKVKGDPTKPPTLAEVASLARKARTARIHLVLSTQRPDAEFLGGEALALDTPIPTPQGWTTMGEIQAGDTVYDHTGAPTVVTTATDVAHGRPCYRVTFSDGSTFITDANHRWLAHSASRRVSLASTPKSVRWPPHVALAEYLAAPRTGRPLGGEVVTTEQMAQSLPGPGGGSNWSVDVAGPIQAPAADLPIDPWLLGYWLGDGHRADATIATNDEEVLDRIRDLGFRVTHYGRFNYGISTGTRTKPSPRLTLVGALRYLGVLDNKHIPASYLRASIAQREALLSGLLDSDGTCAVRGRHQPSGQVVFTSVDLALIDGVAELAASLGFVPTVRQVRPSGVEGHPSSVGYERATLATFAVSFTPDRQVFSLARKRVALDPSVAAQRRATTSRRYVTCIEPVDPVPVRCIAVAAPEHLYLAGQRFIPTHNTRDNFGFRISMGRLSPQGAMMMWENPAVGVSLPRARTGRATATHEDGRPVEVQCYRFPDINAEEGSEERQLLESIRPVEARWPRLVIVPPEAQVDLDGGEPTPPTFRDYAHAVWDLAENRPELDPLSGAVGEGVVDGRELSSTMASLGIRTTDFPNPGSGAPSPHLRLVDALVQDVADDEQSGGMAWELDEYVGYAPPVNCAARDLVVGDLIQIEDGAGEWVVVDELPEEDLAAPGMIAVSWRGDGDESGSISLSDDNYIEVRRPEEDH